MRFNVTLDHLGESTTTREEAITATEDILVLLDEIENAGVRANVSVKLTQIGLALGDDLCTQNLERILGRAGQYGNFVRIDMEDTPYTDGTIQQYRRMRAKGYVQTGLVIQSYLFRSEKDVRELLAEGARIRVVKGAYKEPAELAYPKKADVDAHYDRLVELCLDAASMAGAPSISADGRIPPIPAIGTHDQKRDPVCKGSCNQTLTYPNRRWNSKCFMESGATCRGSVSRKVTRYEFTFHTALIGILILCVAWRRDRRMCGSLSRISSGNNEVFFVVKHRHE